MSCGAAIRAKPRASLRALGVGDKFSKSCGAAKEITPLNISFELLPELRLLVQFLRMNTVAAPRLGIICYGCSQGSKTRPGLSSDRCSAARRFITSSGRRYLLPLQSPHQGDLM